MTSDKVRRQFWLSELEDAIDIQEQTQKSCSTPYIAQIIPYDKELSAPKYY